jgi:hypothetical protein
MSKSILLRLPSVLLASVLVFGCNGKAPEDPEQLPTEPSIPELVSEVNRVTLAVLESEPPQLSITAEGMVSSAGWSDPVLEAVAYDTPPADGIYEFSFTAAPSLDPTAQVMTPIEVSHIVKPMPENLVGVRVTALTNEVTELLEATPQPAKTENIFEISKVTLTIASGEASQLIISAEGSVKTAGWTNPELVPFQYTTPPADGVYDFNFNAVPPGEGVIVPQVITPITTNHTINPLPENLKGVRIHSAQNKKEEMLSAKR